MYSEMLLKYAASNVGLSKKNHNQYACNLMSCRHVYMLTFAYDTLASNGYQHQELDKLNILEIGGGYGNQLHMALQAFGFASFTSFDLDYVQRFQSFFVSKNNQILQKRVIQIHHYDVNNRNQYENNHGVLDNVNSIFFVPSPNVNHWRHFAKHPVTYDLLIATHSLSELPMDDFLMYFYALLHDDHMGVRWVIYSTSTVDPNPKESKEKLNIILSKYEIVEKFYTENYYVAHYALRRRQQSKSRKHGQSL